MALVLTLSAMPTERVFGDYKINGVPDRMPERALYMEPAAAAAYLGIVDELGAFPVSDMFRTPESSFAAIQRGKGALPPGLSAHGFGKAVDALLAKLKALLAAHLKAKRVSKADLDAWLEARGFFCHRRDHGEGKSKLHRFDESWHYNFLGVGTAISPKVKSTAGYVEAQVVATYGKVWDALDVRGAQILLRSVRSYGGKIDGDAGPLFRQGLMAFQRGWKLKESAKLDARTRRTLCFVTHEKLIVPIPALRAA